MSKIPLVAGLLPALKSLRVLDVTRPLVILILIPTVVLAQDDSDQSADEDVFELSPFTVDASEDFGYRATSTLAGSRLKTDFKDVASQVNVLTEELLNDVGVTDVEDALIYSLNVENRTEYSPTDQPNFDASTSTRVRGLGSATRSVNFFETNLDIDRYNTERVTIASGPNAILFGVGNPGGIIDSTLKRAFFKDAGELELRIDSNGSKRASLDVNKTFGDDFALRIAALVDREDGFLDPSFDDQDRIYGTFTYKPAHWITIRANFEAVDRIANRAVRDLPGDHLTGFYHPAFAGGQLFDNKAWWESNNDADPTNNIALPVYLANGGGQDLDPDKIRYAPNPNDPTGPGLFPTQAPDKNNGTGVTWVGVKNLNRIIRDISRPGRSTTDPGNPFYQENWVDNLDHFGFPGFHLTGDQYYPVFDHNLTGNRRYNDISGHQYQVFVELNPIKNLFVELAYNYEEAQEWRAGMRQVDYQMNVDPNLYQPNANPDPDPTDNVTVNPNTGEAYTPWVSNPYAGQQFVESETWGWVNDDTEEELRATVSYEFNVAEVLKAEDNKWLNWMGRHVLSGLVSKRESFSAGQNFFRYIYNSQSGLDPTFITARQNTLTGLDDPGGTGNTLGYITNGPRQRRIKMMQYFAPGQYVAPDIGLDPHDPWWIYDDGRPNDPVRTQIWGGDGRRQASGGLTELNSSAFTVQGYYFSDHLILTYGRRKDDSDVANFANNVSDRATGLNPTYQRLDLLPLEDSVDVTNETKSAVFKIPFGLFLDELWTADVDLRVFYNESSNNDAGSAGGGRRLDGGFKEPVSGEGKDYGIMLDLFNGKYSIRWNTYETSQVGTDVANAFNDLRQIFWDLELATAAIQGGSYSPVGQFDPNQFVDPSAFRLTQDSVSKGDEVTITATPIKGLNLMVTWAQGEAVLSNLGTNWQEAFMGRRSVYESLTLNGDPWTVFTINTIDGGSLSDEPMAVRYQDGIAEIEFLKASENKPASQLRDSRINAIVNYQFSDRFENVNVGGAWRHRAAPVIGFGATTVETSTGTVTIEDLTNPHYGDEVNAFDFWVGYKGTLFGYDYKAQLNIKNAFSDDDLYPTRATSDGTPRHFAISEPRTIIFSLKMDF